MIKGPVARGSIIGLALRLSGLALMFIQTVLAARLLGAEEYGIVTLLLAIAQIATAVVLLGYGSFAVAEIPKGARPTTLIHHASKRIATLSLLVLPAAFLSGVFLLGELSWSLALPLLASIPVLAAIQLLRGVALGLGRPFWGVAPGEVIRPALFVAALMITAFFAQGSSALFIMLYMVTAIIALAIALPGVMRPKFATASMKVAASDKRNWDRAALSFLGIHLATILQLELATLMLGFLASPEAVGLFQPIARVSILLMLPTYALSIAFNPRISGLHAEGRSDEIQSLARKHTLAATVIVSLAGLAVGLGAPALLWLFGTEFMAAAPLVWFLVIGRIVQAACGPGAELLAMTGRSNRTLICLALSLVVEAVLAAILIPIYGLAGAAIGVAIGLGVRGLLLAAASHSVLKIGLIQFWRAAPYQLKPLT